MLLDVDASQLVLVDLQSRLIPAVLDGEQVLANALRLARAAQALGVPIWGTEQNPQKLGQNPPELRALCRDTLAKQSFSAAELLLPRLQPAPAGNARSLPRHLQKQQVSAQRQMLVLAGVEAHVCLLQTALELLDEDYDVWVVTDACSSRTERNRDAAFDRMAAAGVELLSTEMVIFEWLRGADHPQFRALQALIK